MKTDLVHSKNGEVYTSSKIIAEHLQVPHSDLIKTINRVLKQKGVEPYVELNSMGQIFKTETFINKMGREYKMYLLNEQAFIKVIMQLGRYEKAEIIQDLFIEEFYRMKQALLNKSNHSWLQSREQTKAVRKNETDVIKDFVEYATKQGSKNASRYYSNITKMTNKALELLVQTKEGKPLRDLATVTELGFIQVVDNRATEAIKDGLDRKLPYKEIYKFAKVEVENIVDSLCFKKIAQ